MKINMESQGFDSSFPCEAFLNRKTLILGDVKSGKTDRTLNLLRSFIACGINPIGVLDLAPEKISGVGGKIPLSPQERNRIDYFSPRIVPPRLWGKNPEEVLALALENARQIGGVLHGVSWGKYRALFINDLSLYFHVKTVDDLFSIIGGVSTLIMNGYYGRFFQPGAISLREREQMDALMERCEQIFFLPARPG